MNVLTMNSREHGQAQSTTNSNRNKNKKRKEKKKGEQSNQNNLTTSFISTESKMQMKCVILATWNNS